MALIVFSMSSLAPNMQGLQLFRINNLLHHIQHHFGSDWTWTEMKDFVLDHYTSTQLPEDQDEEHKTLPFKSVSLASVSPIISEAPVRTPELLPHFIAEEHDKPSFWIPVSPTIDRSGNIWTPPQLS